MVLQSRTGDQRPRKEGGRKPLLVLQIDSQQSHSKASPPVSVCMAEPIATSLDAKPQQRGFGKLGGYQGRLLELLAMYCPAGRSHSSLPSPHHLLPTHTLRFRSFCFLFFFSQIWLWSMLWPTLLFRSTLGNSEVLPAAVRGIVLRHHERLPHGAREKPVKSRTEWRRMEKHCELLRAASLSLLQALFPPQWKLSAQFSTQGSLFAVSASCSNEAAAYLASGRGLHSHHQDKSQRKLVW